MAKVDVKKREDPFCEKLSTAIWKETPSLDNPYHVKEARCHGYEHLALANNKSFAEVLFLLFRGELPDTVEKQLFDTLLISVIHPGPRHSASRAAMNAAVSKTHVSHILPLALNVMGGEWQGSREVFQGMKFLSRNMDKSASDCARDQVALLQEQGGTQGDVTVAPGFGSSFGSADSYSEKLAENLFKRCHVGPCMQWANDFVGAIPLANVGWRTTGLFSAVLNDLGFTPYQGELLFQIASAPGIAAQAAEKSDKPITDIPFVSDENYTIEG